VKTASHSRTKPATHSGEPATDSGLKAVVYRLTSGIGGRLAGQAAAYRNPFIDKPGTPSLSKIDRRDESDYELEWPVRSSLLSARSTPACAELGQWPVRSTQAPARSTRLRTELGPCSVRIATCRD